MQREELDPLRPLQVPPPLIFGAAIIMGGGLILLGALCITCAQFDPDAIKDVRERWAIRFAGGAAVCLGVFAAAGFARLLAKDEGFSERHRLLRCTIWGSLLGAAVMFAGFLSLIGSYLLQAAGSGI